MTLRHSDWIRSKITLHLAMMFLMIKLKPGNDAPSFLLVIYLSFIAVWSNLCATSTWKKNVSQFRQKISREKTNRFGHVSTGEFWRNFAFVRVCLLS